MNSYNRAIGVTPLEFKYERMIKNDFDRKFGYVAKTKFIPKKARIAYVNERLQRYKRTYVTNEEHNKI